MDLGFRGVFESPEEDGVSFVQSETAVKLVVVIGDTSVLGFVSRLGTERKTGYYRERNL